MHKVAIPSEHIPILYFPYRQNLSLCHSVTVLAVEDLLGTLEKRWEG